MSVTNETHDRSLGRGPTFSEHLSAWPKKIVYTVKTELYKLKY